MSRPSPWIEVPKHPSGLYRASVLARDWERSYLYEGSKPNRVMLSAREFPEHENRLIAVIGPLGPTALNRFLIEELMEEQVH